jgi:hypothetical protein
VHSYNVTYVYDPAGNRTLKNDSGSRTTSTYDVANRLNYAQDSTGRTTFTFDAAGNQIKQKSPALAITTSAWDYENLNKAVLLSASSRVTLVYNGDKLRVEKDAASSGANCLSRTSSKLSDGKRRMGSPTIYKQLAYQRRAKPLLARLFRFFADLIAGAGSWPQTSSPLKIFDIRQVKRTQQPRSPTSNLKQQQDWMSATAAAARCRSPATSVAEQCRRTKGLFWAVSSPFGIVLQRCSNECCRRSPARAFRPWIACCWTMAANRHS